MSGALGLIILAQALAQTVCFHADDGIALLVESRGPPQRFDGDIVFLDWLRRALEILGAYIRKHVREIRGAD